MCNHQGDVADTESADAQIGERQSLIIEPAAPKSLIALLATLSPIEEEFPPIEELPTRPVRIGKVRKSREE